MIQKTQSMIDKVTELKALIGQLDGKELNITIGGDALEAIGVIEDRLDALDNKEITVLVNYKNLNSPDATAQQLVKEVLIPAENQIKPIVQPVIEQPINSAGTGALKEQFQQVVSTSDQGTGAATTAEDALAQAIQVVTDKMAAENLTADQSAGILSKLAYAQQVLSQATRAAASASGDQADSMDRLAAELGKAANDTGALNNMLLSNEDAISRAKAANDDANSSIIRMQMAIDALDAVVARFNGDAGTWNSKLGDARALAATLGDTLVPVSRNLSGFNMATKEGIPLWETGTGWFGAWNSHIQLFGGALTQIGIPAMLATVGTIHLVGDAILETVSTLIPAAIAFGAFGVAAAGVFTDIYSHEKDVFTVTQALQQNMYPFTGQLTALQNAVKPEVYVLFGEALQVITKNTGAFSQLAVGAGHVLDELGARMTYALTSGNGFNQFLKNATSDLAGWGTFIGNIFGIFGNIMKALPGYGQIFLQLADNVTHFLENLTGSIEPLTRFGLALHGALIWLGLAGTVGSWAITGLLNGAATGAGKLATMLEKIPGIGAAAAEGMDTVAIAAGGLADLPWGWILIAATGIGLLVAHFLSAKSAAQQFASTIQNQLVSAPLGQLADNINNLLINATQNMDNANLGFAKAKAAVDALNQSMDKNHTSALQNLSAIQQTNGAYQAAAQKAADWQAVVAEASQDQETYNTNMKIAVGVFGNASTAIQAFTNAGIGSSQFLTDNKQQLAQAIIEAQGYNDALRAASDGAGRFAAAENALSYANEDANNKLGQIDQSMTQVTQAQTQLIGVLTGGESSFIAFQQNMQTLGTDSQATGASMNNLKTNSLTLQAQFYSNVTALQSLINAEEMQGVSTSNLTTEVATGAQQLLQYAGNNQAAKGTVIALINDALGPGTVSFQNLNDWVKQNSTTQQGFQGAIAQTSLAADKLAGVLNGDLNAMMAQSIADAYGGQKAFDVFATQALNGATTSSLQFVQSGEKVIQTLLAQSGNNVPAAERAFISYAENGLHYSQSQAQSLWDTLYSNLNPTLSNTGSAANQAKTDINNFATALANVPKNTQVNFTVEGSGGEYITSSVGPGGTVNVYPVRAVAEGGVMPGYAPGHDSIHALLSPGEGVLIPQAVKALGGEAGINALNKAAQHFAWGGIVGLPAQMSDEAGTVYSSANAAVAAKALATINAEIKAKLAAEAAAAAAAKAAAGGASLGGNVVSWIEAAMTDTGAPASWLPYLEKLVSLESGGNPNAVDPIVVDGENASGLFQTLPSTYAQYATVAGGVFNPIADAVAGIRYIMAEYGSPLNIPGIGTNAHYIGYDQGGYLMPGLTMAYNGTGVPERVTPPGGESSLIHNVINVDGKTIYEATLPYAYQKASRNNGNSRANKYWAPGN